MHGFLLIKKNLNSNFFIKNLIVSVQVNAPWLDKFYLADDDTYIFPGIWASTLGGTRNFGSWNTSVNKYDSAAIWDKCTRIVPRLTTAPVLKEVVGLRPHRDIVRVEPEIINGLKVRKLQLML